MSTAEEFKSMSEEEKQERFQRYMEGAVLTDKYLQDLMERLKEPTEDLMESPEEVLMQFATDILAESLNEFFSGDIVEYLTGTEDFEDITRRALIKIVENKS